MWPTASCYEELFETARRIGIEPDEMRMLFLQMVMNVLGANVDDHSKNFSFIMGKSGEWHISPTYDLTFTVDPSAPFYVNRHSMTINGRNEDISRSDLLNVANRFSIKAGQAIIDKAKNVVSY